MLVLLCPETLIFSEQGLGIDWFSLGIDRPMSSGRCLDSLLNLCHALGDCRALVHRNNFHELFGGHFHGGVVPGSRALQH